MTTTDVLAMKRTELQAAACRDLGKSASSWISRATNSKLREALVSGVPPAHFANGNGSQPDLAAAIAAAVTPLIQTQLDEARVQEIVSDQITSALADVEIRLAEVASQRGPKELRVVLPDGTKADVGQQHALFSDLLHYVAAGENVFAVGPARRRGATGGPGAGRSGDPRASSFHGRNHARRIPATEAQTKSGCAPGGRGGRFMPIHGRGGRMGGVKSQAI